MTIAFVPARSGSKRLSGKNIRLLAGKPLFVWTLQACAEAPEIDKVIFSTDSREYWDIANQHVKSDKLSLDWRSHDEAGDKVKIFDYMQQNVDKIFGHSSDKFLLALPTMPLRNSQHISDAHGLCMERQLPVFSAVEYEAPVSFAFTVNDEMHWTPMVAESPMLTGNTRSQDQAKAFHPNGAIYIRQLDDLRNPTLKTFYQGAIPFIMSREDSVDIDTQLDFEIAQSMMKLRTETSQNV